MRRTALFGFLLGFGAAALLAQRVVASAPGPVAIVYGLGGHATSGVPPDTKQVALFDWLPAGETLSASSGSLVSIAFSGGARYEIGPEASVRLGKAGFESQSGPVRRLAPVPPLPSLASLAPGAAGARAGAVRIRGASGTSLYPREGTASLANSTTLRFGAVAGATKYSIEIADDTGKTIFARETSELSLPVPAGVLSPGGEYSWALRALDSNGAVETVRGNIATLDSKAETSRGVLQRSLEPKDAGSLTLLAGIDQRLGLLWEAREELRQASSKSPQDARLRELSDRLDLEIPQDSVK